MNFVEKRKKRHGDRRDGHVCKDVPVINNLMAILYPNRCDNEVCSTQDIDITETLKYIKEYNEKNPDKNLKFFHCYIAALVRVINERRKLLRFVKNGRIYEKDEIKISFVAKRGFTDKAEEAVVTYIPKATDNVFSVSSFILGQVKDARDPTKQEAEKNDSASVESLGKLPYFIFKIVGKTIVSMDKHGRVPKTITDEDPSFSTVLLSNLGSIKSNSVYHHLNNYGNCSLMMTIGLIQKKKVIMEDGKEETRDIVDVSAIFDERIADGFYFLKTMKLFSEYLKHPETLEIPFGEDSGIKLEN